MFLIELIRGMVIGLANIIPGVSGGTMMVSMGIYEKLIDAITHLFSRPRKSLRFLFPILLGAALAILLLARIFSWLLEAWPIPTNLAFCGLILGSLPAILPQVRFKKANGLCWTAFALFFVIVVAGAFFAESQGEDTRVLSLGLIDALLLFVMGILAAAAMVVPGVSGSMLLMITGYYQPILNTISALLESLLHFDLGALFTNILVLVPFGLGIVVGIFVIAKLVEWVFRHYKKAAYFAILGLVCASPIAILIQTDWSGLSLFTILAGLVTFALGFFAALRLADL